MSDQQIEFIIEVVEAKRPDQFLQSLSGGSLPNKIEIEAVTPPGWAPDGIERAAIKLIGPDVEGSWLRDASPGDTITMRFT